MYRYILLVLVSSSVSAAEVNYAVKFSLIEPVVNEDATKLEDLAFHNLELLDSNDALIDEESKPANSAAPEPNSVVTGQFSSMPLEQGATYKARAQSCDSNVHPDTGEPLPNCSKWSDFALVVIPIVDTTAPSTPTVTVTVTVEIK